MAKKINKKKWSWYRIVNLVVLCILILLTCIFTVLFVINHEKYTVAFLITILFLGVWVIGYFMGHFLFINKDNLWIGARKLMRDYRKKDDDGSNPPSESKEERIKRLEQELADLKKEHNG
ncbi:hypothetical protein C6B38_05250 [Spiroplasma sp. ChiS]|uniref:hypothetical protein n=1 Tax=Spiroplasma sp. ChiS TaxID=2099885 RepID=UPI000CFA44E8|nr:hypothetical protein [Spiroplasma sp. ChiS]PQP78579.1 hypothetical protein C6B38_05250 [Spiroplasma sp. ChiS]